MGMIEVVDLTDSALRPLGPLTLPQMSRDMCQRRSRLTRLQLQGTDQLLGQPLRYGAAVIDPQLMDAATIVELSTSFGEVTLAMDTDLRLLLAELSSTHPLNPALPPDLAAIAVEHILTADIELFETSQDAQLMVGAVRHNEQFDTGRAILRLDLVLMDSIEVTLYAQAEDHEALCSFFERVFPRKEPRSMDTINVATTVVGPLSFIRRRELMGMRRGDHVVLSAEWHALADHLYLNLRDRQIHPLQPVEGGLQVAGDAASVHSMRTTFNEENMPTSDQETAGSLTDPMSLVTVELHRQDLSVSELGMLQNGDVLDFDIQSVELVRVCADGAPIAEGRLVRLDDIFGVQVTKLL